MKQCEHLELQSEENRIITQASVNPHDGAPEHGEGEGVQVLNVNLRPLQQRLLTPLTASSYQRSKVVTLSNQL